MAAELEKVEDVVEDRHRALAALLEPREARLGAVEGNDLAVEHEPLGVVRLERVDDLLEAGVEADVVARQQPHVPLALDGDAADAVELALVYPVRIGEALIGEHRLHRLDAVGQGRGPQELALLVGELCERVGCARRHDFGRGS